MKILLVTGTYPPSANGVAVCVNNLEIELLKHGHDVLVLAPDYKGIKTKNKNVLFYPSIENPLFSDYPIPLLPLTYVILTQLKKFKPDIVHVHHPFHIGHFSVLLAKQLEVPLVFTYHTKYDTYAEKYFNFLPKNLRDVFILNPVLDFCKKTDLVIAPSDGIKESLKTNGLVTRVVTIPSIPGDLKPSKKSKAVLRKKLKLSSDAKILLTVGRLSLEKDAHLLIDSMKYLPEKYVLVICGSGPVENDLKDRVKKLTRSRRVIFTGKVNRNQIADYYKLADYLYFASSSETQGLTFWEAASFGLPIIASDSEASRDWVKPEFGVLVKGNARSLADGVIRVSNMDYLKLHKEALLFSKKFSSAKSVEKLLKEYKYLVAMQKVANKLADTGWQSWSTSKVLKPWSLKRNFNPLLREFISNEKEHNTFNLKKPITGWCSWYVFGRSINYTKIMRNVRWFNKHKEVPIDYILIDEGWCKWGDWGEGVPDKFPGGMNNISNAIHASGFKSGIWIAPFLVERESDIFKSKKSWLAEKEGHFVNGINWTSFDRLYLERYVLDIRKKPVRDYIFNMVDKLVATDGFDLLKLDFLYSIYFIPDITPNEAGGFIRELFLYIRKKHPGVYTIACGSPLIPLQGVADSVRIGPDTISPSLDGIPGVSTIFHTLRVNSVIENIKRRSWTRKYWNLDPDVFVCRESLGLTESKITDLGKSIIKCRGNIFLGDDMSKLPNSRLKKFIMPMFKPSNDSKN